MTLKDKEFEITPSLYTMYIKLFIIKILNFTTWSSYFMKTLNSLRKYSKELQISF